MSYLQLKFTLVSFILFVLVYSCSNRIEDELPADPMCDLELLIEENPIGTLSAIPEAGTAPYNYLWSSGESESTIMPTQSGEYTVTITDAMRCVEESSYVYTDICEGFITEIIQDSSWQLTASNFEGEPPYTYLWSTGETSLSISIEMNSEYDVLTSDSNGCQARDSILVDWWNPCGIVLVLTTTPGMATASATGGAGIFTYIWNTGDTTPTVTNLVAGQYTVTVTDAVGCTVEDSIDVE